MKLRIRIFCSRENAADDTQYRDIACGLVCISWETTAGACIATGIIKADKVISETLVMFRIRVAIGCVNVMDLFASVTWITVNLWS